MTAAFERGGQAAIDKVMKQQPAIFVKMLTLLVPRELEVTHSGAIKAMTDEQIEAAIEQVQRMIAERDAKTIDVTPAAEPPRLNVSHSQDVDQNMGKKRKRPKKRIGSMEASG